jgi:hypothetical protein
LSKEREVRAAFAVEALNAQRKADAPRRPPEPSLAVRQWAQAQEELQRPWLQVLRGIETKTKSPVFLLSLRLEPAKGLVRLEAEAPTFAEAVSYVDGLRDGGEMLPAMMASHDTVPAGTPEQTVVKFTAVTHWVSR